MGSQGPSSESTSQNDSSADNSPPFISKTCEPPFISKTYEYATIDEFYQSIKSMSKTEIDEIKSLEEKNSYILENTHISEGEKQYGMFGYMRDKILKEKALLLPFYQGKQIERYSSITVSLSGALRKCQIGYIGAINDSPFLGYQMLFFDEALEKEANQKGARWLMTRIDPDSMQAYNDELNGERVNNTQDDEIKPDKKIYEKKYQLKDREVLAFGFDHSYDTTNPSMQIYFVYDDMLICILTKTNESELENILTHISLEKVSLEK
jgi:hypothetical protein